MPTFGTVQLPDWTKTNSLFDNAAISQDYGKARLTNSLADTSQQDLDDRAQLRSLAPGLAAADPLGMATASTLGAQGTNAVNSVDASLKARQAQAAYGSGLGAQVASSIASMPDEDSAAAAYPMLRQRAIASGMNPAMLPEQFTGRAGMLAIRNSAVPIATAVELQAKRPYTEGEDPGPLGIPGVGRTSGGAGVNPAPGGGIGQRAVFPPGSFLADLQASESPDPTKINVRGYAGSLQFGADRLQDLGFYRPAQGEAMGHGQNQWHGTFNVPGFPDVKTVQDFVRNPEAQRVVALQHVDNLDQAIASTPGADRLNQEGLRAVAHLGGIGGMRQFVATGGRYNPGDNPSAPGGGTHLSDYYSKYARLAASRGQPGGAGQQVQGQPQPVQVASNAGTAGMPAVLSDASGSTAPGSTISATPQQLNGLLSTYRMNAADPGGVQPDAAAPAGPVIPFQNSLMPIASLPAPPAPQQNSPAPAAPQTFGPVMPGSSVQSRLPPADERFPAPAGQGSTQSPVTAQQAVQQASAELGDTLRTMSPDQANTAVQARAQEIMAGTGATAAPSGSIRAPAPGQPGAPTLPQPGAPNMQRAPASATPGLNPMLADLPAGPLPAVRPNTLYDPAASMPQGGGIPDGPVSTQSSGLTPRSPVVPGGGQPSGLLQAPPGAKPIMIEGKTVPVEGQPGMVQGTLNGRRIAMPLPGTVNTGRLSDVQRPDGGVDKIAPSGQVIYSGAANSRDVQKQDYDRDSKEINGIADSGQAAQTTQIRIQQMRDLVGKLNTGAGGTSRAQLAALAQTYLPEQAAKWAASTAGMSDPAAAQELSKLALRGAGDQERGVLGARGGYQATKLFQAMNPGLDLLPDANKAILNSQLIGAQADADYAAGAMAYHNEHADAFRSGTGSYVPLSKFDQQWQSQRNPQVYAAAMGAIAGLPATDGEVGGKPAKGWATGLSAPEYRRALDIVSRADPGARVLDRSGRTLSMQPPNAQSVSQQRAAPAPPAVGTVMQGHRYTGGDPGSPSSWQRVQ